MEQSRRGGGCGGVVWASDKPAAKLQQKRWQFSIAVSLSPSLPLSLHLFWFISLAQKLLYFDSRQTNVRIEIKREAATGSSEWKTWRERRNRRVGSRITPSSVAATPTSSCSCPSSFDCYTHTHAHFSSDFLPAFPHSHWFVALRAAFLSSVVFVLFTQREIF